MRFTVEYPIGSAGFDRAFLTPATMAMFARSVEGMGIDALAFTEHPAPSRKWLDNGGHESLDPLTALAYCAAVTSRIKLMTYLLVLPFRSPLLAAKQIATADVLSAGRTIVVVGTGYLRSEFAALGVDFAERNDLVDEALEVLASVWATDNFEYSGRHFRAVGQVALPKPAQLPHPPLWIGGNSRKARERVAAYGQGWAPLVGGPQLAATTRTAAIASVGQLRDAIVDLRRLVAAAGRDPAAVDIQVQWRAADVFDRAPAESLELIQELAELGVTWMVLNPPGDNVGRCLDALSAFADRVIGRDSTGWTRTSCSADPAAD